MIVLTPRESPFYQNLYSFASPDAEGFIQGAAGAAFLSRSGLPRDTLRAIWSLADREERGKLNMDEFFVALRLVAHAQAGQGPSVQITAVPPSQLPALQGVLAAQTQRNNFDAISVSHADVAPGFQDAVLQSFTLEKDRTFPEISDSKYRQVFADLCAESATPGLLSGNFLSKYFRRSGLSDSALAEIWDLADVGKDGNLNLAEFIVFMSLADAARKGVPIPKKIPPSLVSVFDREASSFGRGLGGQDRGGGPQLGEERMGVEEISERIARVRAELREAEEVNSRLQSEFFEAKRKQEAAEEQRRAVNVARVGKFRDAQSIKTQISYLRKLIDSAKEDVSDHGNEERGLQLALDKEERKIAELTDERRRVETEMAVEEDALRQRRVAASEAARTSEMRRRDEAMEAAKKARPVTGVMTSSGFPGEDPVMRAKVDGHSWATSVLGLQPATAPIEVKKPAGVGFGRSFFDDRAR